MSWPCRRGRISAGREGSVVTAGRQAGRQQNQARLRRMGWRGFEE